METQHLSKFLADRGAKARFCEETGFSPGFVSDLCSDKAWPRREVWRKIRDATGGRVTPNDHLDPPNEEAPDNADGSETSAEV